MARIIVEKNCECWVLARWKVKSNVERQIDVLVASTLFIFIWQKKHLTLDVTATKSIEKHQCSDESLNIK